MPVIKVGKCLNCGIKHEWLFTSMTLKELREVKKLTGMTVKSFAAASDDGDADAIAALVWVLHKRDKINVSFDDVDLDFDDFSMEPTEDELREMKEAEELEQKMAEAGQGGPKAT